MDHYFMGLASLANVTFAQSGRFREKIAKNEWHDRADSELRQPISAEIARIGWKSTEPLAKSPQTKLFCPRSMEFAGTNYGSGRHFRRSLCSFATLRQNGPFIFDDFWADQPPVAQKLR
jgi:hypothetical protein